MEVRESSARGRRRRGAEGWAAASGQEYLWERTGSRRSPDLLDLVRVAGLGPELRGAIGVGREAYAAARTEENTSELQSLMCISYTATSFRKKVTLQQVYKAIIL